MTLLVDSRRICQSSKPIIKKKKKNGWDRLQQKNMSRSRECPHLYTAVDDPRILRSPLSLQSPIDILTTPRRVVYDAVKGAELSFHPKADGNPLKSTSYRIKKPLPKNPNLFFVSTQLSIRLWHLLHVGPTDRRS